MMKILILTTKPPWPPHEGGAVATMRCIEGFLDNGAVVSVLSMKTSKHSNSNVLDKHTTDQLRSFRSVFVNTRTNLFAMLWNLLFSKEPYDLARFWSDDYKNSLIDTIKNETFDIIQCEGLVFTLYIDVIHSYCTTPVVLRAHNLEHRIRETMSGQYTSQVVRYYFRNLARRVKRKESDAACRFDAVVPISEIDRQWFVEQNSGRPVHLTVCGIKTVMTRDLPVTEGYKAGFIGALDWQPNAKGLLWFLKKVWPQVLSHLPDASFHIAGRNAPEKLISELKGTNVFFLGEVPDAAEFTSSMNIMVSPLFAGSGIRIKIIEAMSLNRVVVATELAAAGIPVTHDKDILIADDEKSFAKEVIKALSDPDLRRRITDAASDMLRKNFDNNRQTAELLEFYHNIINDR